MNAADIIDGLMAKRFRRSFVIPRYTPVRWWECDVYLLTDAGFAVEYEVKTSLADFRADATKDRRIFRSFDPERNQATDQRNQEIVERKHDLLAARDTRGPSQFWFVVPAGLIACEIVPEWAGLIEIGNSWRMTESVVKTAPRLHREPVSAKARLAVEATAYWRMHGAFCELAAVRRARKRIAR